MSQIRSLADVSFEELYAAFSAGFADYEISRTKDQLETMLQRRGYVPELSFGAFDNNRLVSFTLNGIGFYNSQKTAYDTGTATIKEYRGKGLATQIFQHSIPFLREVEVSQYLLEVLQHNTAAVSIYTKAGFAVSREFNYFVQDKNKVVLNECVLPPELFLKFTYLSEKAAMAALCDFKPSWQNNFDALARQIGGFMMLGVFKEEQMVGYGIIETESGDIPQLAVHKDYRRQNIASVLLKELLKYNDASIVKVVNTDIGCSNITAFLEQHNIPLKGKQFEMVKEL
jgi:ribosomal protein S18 acetylase RimI-like enzyme